MPYKLNGNCVVRSDTGETVKCHSTHEQALAHLRALEANVSEANKAFQGALDQDEVHYIPLSTTAGKACANCRWFLNDGCFIVESYEPEPIIATGYCDRWEATPAPPADPVEALTEAVTEAVETINETMDAPMMDMGKALQQPTVLARLAKALKPYFNSQPSDHAFTVFKGSDNAWHWHAVFTNNYEDLEGEILTEKAHDRYIMRLDMGLIPMPELWAWHTPGSKHGEADSVWRNEHFVHAVGHFDDTPEAQKALAFYRKNSGQIKMSHGFTSPEWAYDGKQYKDYNTIEITTLPPKAAANPYTSFEELSNMALTEEKRRYVEQVVGKEKLAEIEAADEQRSKALEDLKVAYKDYADPTATTPDAPVDEPVRKAYLELVNAQNDVVSTMTLMGKALEAKDTQIKALETKFDTETKAWQKELDVLRAIVNAPPRRPSQDTSTIVKESDDLSNKLPAADALSQMFPGLIKEGAS